MSQSENLISVDGKVTSPEEAVLPLPDDGLYRGDGVFEVVRIYRGKPFTWNEHLDRMGRSAATIELDLDRDRLEAEAKVLLDRRGPEDFQLRLIATRSGRRILATETLPVHDPSITLASVTASPTVILNGVKSLSYALNMEATRLARAKGAEEALLVRPDGIVLEAPTSSLFWGDETGQLYTTAVEAGVLASVTRKVVIERLPVETGEYSLDRILAEAAEAFIASTTREIQPVAAIDDREFDLARNQATTAARAAFAEALAEAGI